MTPHKAYHKCNGKINKELEPFFIKESKYVYDYALNVIKGRWIEAEPYIKKNPHYACLYARVLIRGRWKEAEQYIMNDSKYSYYYATDIIQGKLPENMHNAMLLYADTWAKKYFNYIKNNPQEAYIKCEYKINKDLEKIIIKDPYYAYYYAQNIIKDRWIEAENIISTDSECAYYYATNVIKGKLPELMHNAMIIHADYYAKRYFDFIK